jgi:hypothetical protein
MCSVSIENSNKTLTGTFGIVLPTANSYPVPFLYPQGLPGDPGVDGIDGEDGIPGQQGRPGKMVREWTA